MTLKERVEKISAFVRHSVATLPGGEEGEKVHFFARLVRVVHLLFRGYMDDDLTIHAASLTFVTLNSLVPFLAVMFAFAKSFGIGADRMEQLAQAEWVTSMPLQIQEFITKVIDMVNHLNLSALGGVGAAFFLVTAVLMLANIEKSFNRVWSVNKNRSIPQQIMSYTAVLVLVPILFIVAGAMRARITYHQEILGVDANLWLQSISAFSIIWLALWFLYTFVPNTRVHFKPGLAGSLVMTFVLIGWMKMFTIFKLGVTRSNAIYGAFAAIPIFMFWLYVTWVILLLGAEFVFALQNADTYALESGADDSSMRARILVALMILRQAGRSMSAGGPKFDTYSFARRYKAPIRLVNAVVDLLEDAGYLAKVADGEENYVLTRSPEGTPVSRLLGDFMRAGGGHQDLESKLVPGSSLHRMLEQFRVGLDNGYGSLTLADLIASAPNETA